MKLYHPLSAIESLISQYIEKGGQVHTLAEGSLGYGKLLLTGGGLQTCLVQEKYVNDSSSGYALRFYNRTPKKYLKLL